MSKLILGMFVSHDGFVSGPNGETDWIFRAGDGATDAWIVDRLSQAGSLAMGSRSYLEMASYWPSADSPFATPMNALPKVVFTRNGADFPGRIDRSASAGTWANPTVASAPLTAEIARLKAESGKDIRVLGGATFAQSLAAHDLVDEYQFLVCPVALGGGIALFSGLAKPLDLDLVNVSKFAGGVIALDYRRR